MPETTLAVGLEAQPTAPTERRQGGHQITVVMLDDEALILTASKRILQRTTDEVVDFHEKVGDSKIDALVVAVREALAKGHHVVVLSDGNIPNGTTPLTVRDALVQAGVLATRAALEAWMNAAKGDETVPYPAGAPLVVVSGGISDPTLEKDVEAAIASGDIIGILGKPFNANQLRELVLGLATRDREVLLGTIEGIARTF